MSSVKCLGNELHEGEGSTSEIQPTGPPGLFPSLIELTIEYMEKLESWDVPESTLSPFPLLEKLTISFCNKFYEILRAAAKSQGSIYTWIKFCEMSG